MKELLVRALAPFGVTLDDTALSRFQTYCDRLVTVNQVMNLTAITDPREVYLRHFADSAALCGCAPFEGARVIDVGTGAGFPGLPLKIACPSISLTLLDSLRTRIDFLKETCQLLGFPDVNCVHGRAEECALLPEYRDRFDIAVSRAVSPLPMLCELCLPYVRPGGVLLAMKSREYEEELSAAAHAITALCARVENIWDYTIEGAGLSYCVIVIQKLANTPAKYPRRFAKIQKNPL